MVLAATGQPLPDSEVQALNDWPSWVGECGATATGTTSTAPTTTGTLDGDVGASEFTDSQGYKSDSLSGTYSYAELSPPGTAASAVTEQTATALGKLPYKQKLAITYQGKTVVAEKLDIGQGGADVNGKKRAIDLIYDKTAQALGINDPNTWTGVVHVQTVDDSTPLGPTSAPAPTTTDPTATGTGTGGCCPGGSAGGSGTGTSGGSSQNAKTAFDYLAGKPGMTAIAAAALVGNMQQESGPELNTTDTNGSTYGIVQWLGGRRTALENFAASDPQHRDVSDLNLQLDFTWHELTTDYQSSVLTPLEHDNDVNDATNIVFTSYEGPNDSTLPKRQGFARDLLRDAGTPATASSGSGSCSSGTAAPTGAKPNFVDLSGGASASLGHGKLTKINALVIHYTEGSQEGAALRDFFVNSTPGYGVQFNIGLTGKVYNYFPLDNMQEAWHVGDINDHSIGIEITGADGNALLNNDAQYTSVVNTVQYLCSYYHIPCSSPKGDITGDHNNPDQAQGLLGHDESPNPVCGGDCDHSDPDTRISSGGTEYDITTGKVWTNADRSNSSVHAYMMKLRKSLGYNPTP